MKEIRVLYGFSSERIANSIESAVRSLGYKVTGTMRPTKQMLKEYVESHPKTDAVVIKEYLDGGARYGIEEIVGLADDVNTNFIVILNPSFRGKDAMKELYSAGILNVIFSDEKKGVKPELIAELIISGRTRRQAREYYHIDRKVLKRQMLTKDEYDEMYSYLANRAEGINLMERFVTVSRWVSPEQLAIFIRSLPEEACTALKKYKEFYDINNKLFRQTLVGEKLKCPKDAIEGLSPDIYAKKKNTDRAKSVDNRAYQQQPEDNGTLYEAVVSEGMRNNEMPHGGQGEGMKTDFREFISSRRREGGLQQAYDPVIPSPAGNPEANHSQPVYAGGASYGPQYGYYQGMAAGQVAPPPLAPSESAGVVGGVQQVSSAIPVQVNTAPRDEARDALGVDEASIEDMDVDSILQLLG